MKWEAIDFIRKIGKTDTAQKSIGEKIGWSRGKANQFQMILENIDTDIIKLTKGKQNGRGAKDAPFGANFTEGWFRNSGLYDLKDTAHTGRA